jgi:hypothetical protein
MKYIVTLIISFFIAASAQAQTDSSLYYQYYGGKAPKSNKPTLLHGMILKVNLASAICGDIPFTVEKVFGGVFGLELGAGIMPGYYIPENNYLYAGGNPYLASGLSVGYSLYLCPKFYTEAYGPDDSYYGGLFRIRHYNLSNGGNVQYMDIAFNSGTQILIADHITFEYNYGLGVRLRKETDALGQVISTNGTTTGNIFDGLITPIGVKIGYMF